MRRSVSALALFILGFAAEARAAEKLRVILSDRENLQYLPFWVAQGGGFFRDAGVELEPMFATEPGDAERMMRQQKAPIAVLPPPMYINLIASKVPIVVVANLLAN